MNRVLEYLKLLILRWEANASWFIGEDGFSLEQVMSEMPGASRRGVQ